MSKAIVKTVKKTTVVYLDERFIADYKAEVADFNATGKRFAELTLRIGMRLEFAKTQLPHGQLNKWITEHGGVSITHARRCRQLAQVFIASQHVGQDEMLALVDPANSQKELAKKLEQMAFDFIADRTQAELFAEYGIQVRDKKQLGGAREAKPKALTNGETQKHRDAVEITKKVMDDLCKYFIGDTRVIQHLTVNELKAHEADLTDAILNVRKLIKAG